MKKAGLALMLLVLAALLSGCASGAEEAPQATLTLEEELAQQTVSPEFASALAKLQSAAPTDAPQAASALDPTAVDYREIKAVTPNKLIDWDLSRFSTTMAYGQLTDMLMYPDKYIGQTVRLKGTYRPSADENGNIAYHFLIIYDQTACCELGIEFAPTTRATPLAVPAPEQAIQLTGVFDLCYDMGEQFACLRVNDITSL